MNSRLSYYRNYNNYLKNVSGLDVSPYSKVRASVQPLSRFKSKDELELPLTISGRLVTSGKYDDNTYGQITLESSELQKTVSGWENMKIYSSHDVFEKITKGQDVSVGEVIGKITKTEWNQNDGGIDFFAEIYDEDIAFKILNGVINFISVGFARDVDKRNGQYYFINLDPKETSLVFDPRDPTAKFTPVE